MVGGQRVSDLGVVSALAALEPERPLVISQEGGHGNLDPHDILRQPGVGNVADREVALEPLVKLVLRGIEQDIDEPRRLLNAPHPFDVPLG